MTDLGTLTDPKGRRTSEAYAINRDGLVVGKSYATVGVHAFLWLPTPMFGLPPGLNDLGTLGGTSSWAYAINSNAKIVGQAYLSGSGIPRPVIWEPAGTGGMVVRDLGTLGGTFGRARAINEAGAIVGVSSLGTGGSTQACIWLDQPRYGLPAGVTQLVFNGGTSTECYDINNHGQVVGRAQIGGGFVWLPEPAFGLPAGVTSFAADPWRIRECNAINDAGDIAATSIDVEGIPHGVVLRGTTLIDLSTAVRPRDQWQVVDAFDVNSDGVVVGSAVRNGEQHAVLLIPIGLRQAITTLEPDDRTTP
jgi:probable HAF family extracellular repeat protein